MSESKPEPRDGMSVLFYWNGDTWRIPAIGEKMDIPNSHWKFLVEGYGERYEDPRVTYKGDKPAQVIVLIGCLSLPEGSPMEALERGLEGDFFTK